MTLPSALLPYQRRWMEDDSPVRVWEKSRRIGASWTVAAESVVAGARLSGGRDTWYTSYNKEATAEFIRDCAWWAKIVNAIVSLSEELELDEETGEEVLTYVIRFSTGRKITALSSRPANLRNRKGRLILDEAAHVHDFSESMKSAMAILMWGGGVDILSTHNGVDSGFNKLLNDCKAGRRDYSLHHTDLDGALADGLYKRICLVQGKEWTLAEESRWRAALVKDYGDDADEELFCVPKRSGGQYLSRPLIESCMYKAPVYRYEAPANFAALPDGQRGRTMLDWIKATLVQPLAALTKEHLHAFGEDFGRTADLTAIAPLSLLQDLRKHIPFIVELRDVPFREQELCLKFIVDRLPRFFFGALDATGNGQYLAERAWQKYGEARIECVNLSNKWYAENLPLMRADFEDRRIDVPLDADVLGDLSLVQVINGTPKIPDARTRQTAGGVKKSSAAKRHGDDAIAIALAHYASRQSVAIYEYNSVKQRTMNTPTATGRTGFRSTTGGVL